jgi:hypothetical protein
LSDLCGKGIVRGQVENTNLRAYSRKDVITAAEAIMTCITNSFYGRNYVDAVECLNDKRVAPNSTKYVEVDARSKRKGNITFRDMAVLYGQRPNDKRLWYLSPYEFESDWEVRFLSYPQSLHDTYNPRHHAELTDAGIAKLHNRQPGEKSPELYPGQDYVVKDG